MIKFCERVINGFSNLFFEKVILDKKKKKRHTEYTLSSVFPTKSIMSEVKRHI